MCWSAVNATRLESLFYLVGKLALYYHIACHVPTILVLVQRLFCIGSIPLFSLYAKFIEFGLAQRIAQLGIVTERCPTTCVQKGKHSKKLIAVEKRADYVALKRFGLLQLDHQLPLIF